MIVMLLSIGFWSLVLLVLSRLTLIALQHHEGRHFRTGLVMWGALVLVALVALMRPHEDIFGGQDTGAYPNMGARLGREHRLLYEDPLLKLVPQDTRHDFFYYDEHTMYPTEYGSGAVLDVENAIAGSWFQPAMAITMSLLATIGQPRWVLYVAPLFTLLTALALGVLSSTLIPRKGVGFITSLCFLVSPIVLWHGRAPRPEMVAAFLLCSGATLMLRAWRQPSWHGMPDLLLGAVCISIAPLFHAIAWNAAALSALIVGIVILSGRPDFLVYPLVAAFFFALFITQITCVVDTYRLARFVQHIIKHPALSLGWFILVFALMATCSYKVRSRMRTMPIAPRPALKKAGGPVLAAILLTAVIGVYVCATMHRPSQLDMIYRFMHPTDLTTVLNMISVPIGILALAGLVVLALRRPSHDRKETAAFLLFAGLPALAIGYMYDFFMVRYTLVSLQPLVALGLASLITIIPLRGMRSRVVLAACTLAICGLAVRGRTHLVAAVEYRGFVDFVEEVARPLRSKNAILLGEYSKLASPLDHYSGIPALGLHNERLFDYQKAELAWKGIMETLPDRPAFFLTPFARPPVSEHFTFELVDTKAYEGPRLAGRRWGLPLKEEKWACQLRVYRMRLADEDSAILSASPDVFRFGFDAGNMGLRNFANCRTFNTTVMGKVLDPGEPMALSFPAVTDTKAEAWFFMHSPDADSAPDLTPTVNGAALPFSPHAIAPNWWLCRAPIPASEGAESLALTLSANKPGNFVASARLVRGLEIVPLFDGWRNPDTTDRITLSVDTRWARQGAHFTVPRRGPADGRGQPCGYACIFAAGPEEVAEEVTISMGTATSSSHHRRIPTGVWLWEVWPLVPDALPHRTLDVQIDTDTPFDPQNERFPKDLALLMGYVAEVPANLP
jgi:hypothetical protein